MYIYHALINVLNAHVIHIDLTTIFYTHVEHSSTKTIYIKCYTETHYTHTHTHARTHARTHKRETSEYSLSSKTATIM